MLRVALLKTMNNQRFELLELKILEENHGNFEFELVFNGCTELFKSFVICRLWIFVLNLLSIRCLWII
ncbi:hypothetical protein Hanom_Chr02g00141461 [Helianthus anomalus]